MDRLSADRRWRLVAERRVRFGLLELAKEGRDLAHVIRVGHLADQIRRAASRTRSVRRCVASPCPPISPCNFSRVRSDACILSIGVLPCWSPVIKPDLDDSPSQARVHPNRFSSKFRTSPGRHTRALFWGHTGHRSVAVSPVAAVRQGCQRTARGTPCISWCLPGIQAQQTKAFAK